MGSAATLEHMFHSNVDSWQVQAVTNMREMFYGYANFVCEAWPCGVREVVKHKFNQTIDSWQFHPCVKENN